MEPDIFDAWDRRPLMLEGDVVTLARRVVDGEAHDLAPSKCDLETAEVPRPTAGHLLAIVQDACLPEPRQPKLDTVFAYRPYS